MKTTGEYKPVLGKTYSLFGSEGHTTGFFSVLARLTDEMLARLYLSEKQLLETIRVESRHRGRLRRTAASNPASKDMAYLLQRCHEVLSEYITGIEEHLRTAPLLKNFTDKGLLTTREQYYLYMLEFELVNRIDRETFFSVNYRIALMPYCLRETQTDCKAAPDEIDYQCKSCVKSCYINRLSKLLRESDVHPYIWRTSSLRPLLKKLSSQHSSIGVLGIACVVELVQGMRLCMKAGLPIIGIPLNANRCPRWMDEFYDTSIDLAAAAKLLAPTEDKLF